MNSLSAIVLDFDGVILESADIKTRAFEALFADVEAEARGRIVAHHLANEGISRFEKFRWAYREVLRRELTLETERALGERYNKLVEEAVVAAEWVPGAREFIAACQLPLFIASGAPQEELRRIVGRRQLMGYFRGIYGSPATKPEILRVIAHELGCPRSALVLVGDALNDHDAAQKGGARFIGRRRRCAFPEGTPTIADLRELPAALARL